jgi:tetratricopeptide (TPR) repeat protein
MDCSITDRTNARLLVNVFTWVFILVAVVGAVLNAANAHAQSPARSSSEVLAQVSKYEQQFRTGDMSVVRAWVAMLEEATRTEPDNADLWYALGYVYLTQNAQAMLTGASITDIMPNMQKGPAALRRALQINPDHPEALSQLGGVQVMMGLMTQAPAMTTRGLAQMNRGIALAPDSTRVRLMRAFAGPNLPEELRNHAAEAEDLEFLIDAAQGSRSGDYMMIMRADLHFEDGQRDAAASLYTIAADSRSSAAAMAKTRLAQLRQGGVAAADIKDLRAVAGAQCAMCHGSN